MIKSFFIMLCLIPVVGFATPGTIVHSRSAKTIRITAGDHRIAMVIDYSSGACIRQLFIKGENKLAQAGAYSAVYLGSGALRSDQAKAGTGVIEAPGSITLTGIRFGNGELQITETWRFRVTGDGIDWDITRHYDRNTELQDMAFPKWHFASMSTWKGGILDNGGMVWCKYLAGRDDTYGVHTGGVTFWNPDSGDGLAIAASVDKGQFVAAKYSRGADDAFSCSQLATSEPLQQRYALSRFVRHKQDVFAPFRVLKGSSTIHLRLSYVDYLSKYSRGRLPGIDAAAVRELLNTTGRYGVVDNNIIGGNGWTSNWKCLHEPFFAQTGMAVDDINYTRNFSSTLDQERDEAMLPDGRVLSRWHDVTGDEIPGTYNRKTGYYEAMWGYTIDSQTGYLINLSEQFDLNGDLAWLRGHKASAERALNWLIRRDANHNGLFEMMNNNISERKSSDWLDIVYASYENAFVNAQMYAALVNWAACEEVLGDRVSADRYAGIAQRLKTAFNRPVEEGGFWSAAKKQYVYWRDHDGSIHGDNLVTPVNFAAIAFGVCDDPARIPLVLDQIEQRTTAEHLFHWPLCFDSFKQEEVQEGNWPYPKYENGDIFPTWGYLGIRAYTTYNKEIALKYIRNILSQYRKDGLSSQRYSRLTQLGQGDDILAGICTSVTALYRDIYGVRPKWNRMGLEPAMSDSLYGADFNYTLRDTVYRIHLDAGGYTLSTKDFSIRSRQAFGASKHGKTLMYFRDNRSDHLIEVSSGSGRSIKIRLNRWDDSVVSWTVSSADRYKFRVTGLRPGAVYHVRSGVKPMSVQTSQEGVLAFSGNGAGTVYSIE